MFKAAATCLNCFVDLTTMNIY